MESTRPIERFRDVAIILSAPCTSLRIATARLAAVRTARWASGRAWENEQGCGRRSSGCVGVIRCCKAHESTDRSQRAVCRAGEGSRPRRVVPSSSTCSVPARHLAHRHARQRTCQTAARTDQATQLTRAPLSPRAQTPSSTTRPRRGHPPAQPCGACTGRARRHSNTLTRHPQ